MKRSVQDLLAERRANVLEMFNERDKTARQCLQAHIAYLDRLIEDFESDDEFGWEREETRVG